MRIEANSAGRYGKARADGALELASDYLELIDDLISELGEARAVDLRIRLGVSHVTVTKTLQRLSRDGYVFYRPHRRIFLTDSGRAVASAARDKHQTILKLLVEIGVPDGIAEQDAEGMEHHVSPETLVAIEGLINRLRSKI
jgi:DtxR family manganese transport transcriptional regulator